MKLTFIAEWPADVEDTSRKALRLRLNSVIQTYNDLQRRALQAHLRGELDQECVTFAVRALACLEETKAIFAFSEESDSPYLNEVLRMRDLVAEWLKDSAANGTLAPDEAQRLLEALGKLEVAVE